MFVRGFGAKANLQVALEIDDAATTLETWLQDLYKQSAITAEARDHTIFRFLIRACLFHRKKQSKGYEKTDFKTFEEVKGERPFQLG